MQLMSEYSVGFGHKRDGDSEMVSVDRISVIGYIGVWSNRLRRFPLPLLALDGQPQITRFENATRVQGLLPSDWDDDHLMSGHWTGQVDIKPPADHGEGEVYLGNANTPSETKGFVFEHALPFNPELELGFVRRTGREIVLRELERDGASMYLIYADSTDLDALDRVHPWRG